MSFCPLATPRRRPDHRVLSLGCLLGAAAGCGAPKIQKPPAPDMAQLVERYDAPDGSLVPDESADVLLAVTAVDALLAQTDLREQLVEVLEQVLAQAVNLSTEGQNSGLTIEADGYMLVTRICTGWAEPVQPDRDANGALVVTATFSASGLDPIVWGSASTCRYRVGDSQVELDGISAGADAVSVYWGDAVEQQALEERALLVDLNLNASIDGEVLALDLDFRSLADGTIEYRIPRADGSLIAHVGADDVITLRAANGVFECTELDCREISAGGM